MYNRVQGSEFGGSRFRIQGLGFGILRVEVPEDANVVVSHS